MTRAAPHPPTRRPRTPAPGSWGAKLRALTALALLVALAACGGQPPPPANASTPTVTLEADRLTGEATFVATFQATASDPDGLPLRYAWSLDGVNYPDVTGPAATVTFDEAGSYRVTVRVSNGVRSATASLTVQVRNEYRPSDAPDVLVVGFAGRCGIFLVNCLPPDDNRDYLGDSPAPGTMTAIASAFDQLGYSVALADFRAHLFDDPTRGFGFQSATELVRFVRDEWVRDFRDPTRLVLVGHSHGAQFMSLLAFDNPDVTFDYGIYLDAVCNLWDADHIDTGGFALAYGAQANYPYPLNLTGAACDALLIDGLAGGQHIGDVVPWNVTWALEVQSNGADLDLPGIAMDWRDNHRPDGTTVGITTAYFPNETHQSVKDGGTPAMNWVVNAILTNGLPALSVGSQSEPQRQDLIPVRTE